MKFQRHRPESGAERQAAYRERHPDRVAAYNARRRAQRRDWMLRHAAAQAEQLAAHPLALPAAPVRPALPAPVEMPLFILPQRTPEPVLVEAWVGADRGERVSFLRGIESCP